MSIRLYLHPCLCLHVYYLYIHIWRCKYSIIALEGSFSAVPKPDSYFLIVVLKHLSSSKRHTHFCIVLIEKCSQTYPNNHIMFVRNFEQHLSNRRLKNFANLISALPHFGQHLTTCWRLIFRTLDSSFVEQHVFVFEISSKCMFVRIVRLLTCSDMCCFL